MDDGSGAPPAGKVILTPDQRVRVFVSSTMGELADERKEVRRAIERLHLAPVLFELGARAHPPRSLYSSYLDQSHVFLGIYWERYGWIGPDMEVSGLEDEYLLSGAKPKLIYVKEPAPTQERRLTELLDRIRASGDVSYKPFASSKELERLVEDDLAMLLSEAYLVAPDPGMRRPRFTMPGEISSFVGRERELAAVTELLGRDDVRLVTFTGPGGVGKTRLALRAAAANAAAFEEGVAFVDLAPLRDAHDVPAAIAAAINLREVGGESLHDALRADLGERSLLLVLDNFEHVLDAAGLVAELLAAAPRVKALVTSRETLRIRAEHEFGVPPLEVTDSLHLFEQRAAGARHGFAVTPDNEAAVDAICERLEHVPLAIELAAARVRHLPPEAVLERLERGLDFLGGGARDLPDRQRTLRSTVQWSFDLLTDDERELFATVSVFEGSFSLDAVEAVATSGAGDVLDLLASLVDKSLLRTVASAGEPRFRMLAMIQSFAGEQLEQNAEAEAIRERHALHYRDLGIVVGDGVRGPDQVRWLERYGRAGEGDAENLRAALAWLLAQGRLDEYAEMAWATWVPVWIHGRLEQGRRLARDALDAPGGMSDRSRARLLMIAGLFDMWSGAYGGAMGALDEARELGLALDDDEIVAYADIAAALAVGPIEGEERAATLAGEGRELCRRLGDRWGELAALNVLVWLYAGQERFDDTGPVFEETVSIACEIGDEHFEAMAEVNLAEYRIARGELEEAGRLLLVSAARYRSLRSMYSVAYLLDADARLALARGDPARAARLLGAADQRRESIGVGVWGSQLERRVALVEHLGSVLGADAFDEAQLAGRSLDYFEALDAAEPRA